MGTRYAPGPRPLAVLRPGHSCDRCSLAAVPVGLRGDGVDVRAMSSRDASAIKPLTGVGLPFSL